MKKVAAIGLAALALGAAVLYLTRPEPRPWTTSSEEALAEFHKGLEAAMKLYHGEALHHFQQALELDPSFVAPMIWIASKSMGEESKAMKARLTEVDLNKVSPRERVLVERLLLSSKGQGEEARALLTRYLSEYPDDPFVLFERCFQLRMVPKKAEDCFRRLIAVEPNFVQAQNHLGYLAMGQGDFEEAEERFRIYQYLAPDQANPHDSMGELLLVLGRYDEAKEELEKALALRPDFSASFRNLLFIALLQDDWDAARAVVGRAAEAGLEERALEAFRCEIEVEEAARMGDWEALWQTLEGCRRDRGSELSAARFRAALWTGRMQVAEAVETALSKRVAEAPRHSEFGGNFLLGRHYHLRGIRLATEGQLDEAADALRQADRWIQFEGFSGSTLKLANLLTLAVVLDAGGKTREAEEVRGRVAAVNPTFLRFEDFLAIPSPPGEDTGI